MLWVYLDKNCRYNHKYRYMRGDVLEDYTDREIIRIIHSLPESCVLDVADQGFHTLEEVGELIGLSHRRIHQLANGIGPVKGFLEKMRERLDGESEPYRKAVGFMRS